MLFVTVVVGTFVFSTDIAYGESVGNALIDALISFVVFGAVNLFVVALVMGRGPTMGWLTPRRAWFAAATVAFGLLIATLAERSGVGEALVVAVPLAAAGVWFGLRHTGRT